MFVKLKTQTGVVSAPFFLVGREKSPASGEENAPRIHWGHWRVKATATATAAASRGNNNAINNKAKGDGEMGWGKARRKGRRQVQTGGVEMGGNWVNVPLEVQQQSPLTRKRSLGKNRDFNSFLRTELCLLHFFFKVETCFTSMTRYLRVLGNLRFKL